ncbi:NB-ARC domain-containing protein [Crossiella sp. NPDC003009]
MRDERAENHNQVDRVMGDLVQVGVVHGGVHLHHSGAVSPARRPSLPSGPRAFVNQVGPLAALDRLLVDRPEEHEPIVATISAGRGFGKTALCLHWGNQHESEFPDGRIHVGFGAWTDRPRGTAEVLAEVLEQLGCARAGQPTELGALSSLFRELTRGKAYLLVLDDVVAPNQVTALLPSRGRSMVLATGSDNLRALAVQGAHSIELAPLEDDMAELFLSLAEPLVPLMAEQAEAVRAVLDRCHGVPVLLDAVRAMLLVTPGLDFRELLAELDAAGHGVTSMRTSGGEPVDLIFDVVVGKLGPEAAACHRFYGLHPGFAALSVGVLAAATGLTEAEVRKGMRELLGLRLVEPPTADRYAMHPWIRSHAAGLVRRFPAGADDEILTRTVDSYLTVAASVDQALCPNRPWRARMFPELSTVDSVGRENAEKWLLVEVENLRAVVELAEAAGEHEKVVRFGVLLWSLFLALKRHPEALAVFQAAARSAQALRSPLVESVLRTQIGFVHRHCEEFDDGQRAFDAAIALARTAGDLEARLSASEGLGLMLLDQGRVPEALELLRENLAGARLIEDPRRIALAELHDAKAEQPGVAQVLLTAAEATFRGLGEQDNAAKVQLWQGKKLIEAGQLGDAGTPLAAALDTMTRLERDFDRGEVHEALAELATARGEHDSAQRHYRAAADIYAELGLVRQVQRAVAYFRVA